MEIVNVWNVIAIESSHVEYVLSSDVDECSTANICDDNKYCINTQGSYTCRCNSGFNEAKNGKCQGSYCSQLIVYAKLHTCIMQWVKFSMIMITSFQINF